jgi:RHS repeat-associated protein
VTDSGGAGSLQTFSYDPYGNMWSSATGSLPMNAGTPVSNVYNTANQLTTASYDGAGNQTSLPSFCTGCLSYDAEDRLVSYSGPSPTTYQYDANGARVVKKTSTTTTVYVYDAFGTPSAEYSSNPTPASTACDRCYISWDHLGNTRMVTDVLGNVVSFHDYLAYGTEINSSYAGRTNPWGGTSDNDNERFTGQQHDSESGLDYFNARYYAAALGRFTSPDPGNAGADPTDPQTWNAYAYVRNSPPNSVDPSGMSIIQCEDPTSIASVANDPPSSVHGNPGCVAYGTEGCILSPVSIGPLMTINNPGQTGSSGGGGGVSATTGTSPAAPPKTVARPDWLNSITSIFGYDQRIKLPSCFVDVALKTAADDLNPFTPGAFDVGQGALQTGQAVKYNQALTYAAAKGLTYPFKSSVFRGIMKTSNVLGKFADTLPLINVNYALTDGLLSEIKAMNRGECQ